MKEYEQILLYSNIFELGLPGCLGGLPTENKNPVLGKFDSYMEHIFIGIGDFEFISLS